MNKPKEFQRNLGSDNSENSHKDYAILSRLEENSKDNRLELKRVESINFTQQVAT